MKGVGRYSCGMVLVGLLAACGDQAPAPAEAPVRPVKSALVGGESGETSRVFPGKLRAADKVDLSFQVAGRLKALHVLNGMPVEKGEVIAELDSRDYDSNLKAAEAEFSRARAEFERMGPLLERQLVSRSEYDQKRAERDIAEANVERMQKALNDTRLTAPFAGVVAHRFVENFQEVNAKQPIVSLQDSSYLEVVLNVPENLVLTLGQNREQVTMSAAFDALPGRTFPLGIKEFSTEADPVTQSFEVVMAMEAPADIEVFAGMTVSVQALLPAPTGKLSTHWIPAAALFADREGGPQQYVWVIEEPGTVSRRAVAVGSLRSDLVEITDGISRGERIVTAGVHSLQPGDRVRLLAAAGE